MPHPKGDAFTHLVSAATSHSIETRQSRSVTESVTLWMRQTRVVLAAAHLDHDPSNNRLRNLKSLCQRCHIIHDRPHHLAQRRITYLLRRALGDLFLGPYSGFFPLGR